MKLSHIALAAPKIDDVLEKLRVLELKVKETHEVPSEKVKAAMVPVEFSPHFRIEILEPTAQDSPIAKFLERKPAGGMHHLCFEVSQLERWLKVVQDAGLEVLPPGIRKAARGKAFFIHPKSLAGVLVELEEIA
ncbi:VOC family protein [bacterium]|nr:VOC family protein [bacterium]